MFRIVALSVLASSSLASVGCSTLAKQVYYGVRGASGKFYELNIVDPLRLATFRAVQFAPFENALGERVPAEVVAAVDEHVPEVLADSHLFFPDGKPLRIEGRIVHYTGKSGLIGALSSFLGGQECVSRVRLVDADTGELIGEAMCWGSVKSAVRQGPEEFGKGVGKGIAKWIEDRLPEDVVEQRREMNSDQSEQ